MGVNSPTGPGGPAPSGTSPPPEGSPPPGGKPTGTEGAPPPGGEGFGTTDGVTDSGEFFTMATALAGDDESALKLINQAAQANNIRLNTVSHEASAGAGAFREMSDGATEHRTDSADSFLAARETEARTETRGDISRALTEFQTSGDSRELRELFARFSTGDRATARSSTTTTTTTTTVPTGTGTGLPVPPGGGKTPGSTSTGAQPPPNPPIFPTTTDPRLANVSTRTPTFVPPIAPRDPSKPPTPEQELETQLRAALSGSPPDEEAAKAALDGLAAMGIELGPEQETDEVRDRADLEVAESGGEGEGDAGRMPGGAGGESGDRRARAPRAVTFSTEHLSEGLTMLSGGGRGGDADVDAHGARMERGLTLVCGGGATGYATHVATTGAVRGTYAEGDSSGDGSGTGGGSNPHDPVGFGSMADPSGRLAASGYGIIETPGPMGNFAVVHTATGRVYGMDDARLPADARPGVRSWMSVGREVRARAMAGASFSGDYYNSRGIC